MKIRTMIEKVKRNQNVKILKYFYG